MPWLKGSHVLHLRSGAAKQINIKKKKKKRMLVSSSSLCHFLLGVASLYAEWSFFKWSIQIYKETPGIFYWYDTGHATEASWIFSRITLLESEAKVQKGASLHTLEGGPLSRPQLLLLFGRYVMSDPATPRTAAHKAPLSFTISQSLLRFMSIESVTLFKHLIFCHPQ